MNNKNVLLTGASGGLGKHITAGLAAAGYNLALQYNTNSQSIAENIKDISNLSIKVKAYKADITTEADIVKLVSDVKEDFGSIDMLINNAGISINAMSWKLSGEDWNKVLSVNLTGPFLCTKHVLPLMKENKYGRIIYISSVVPQIGVPGTAAYAASKAGLGGLCKTISKEVIKNNITANMISLGYFDAGLLYQIPEEIRGQIKETIPVKHFGNPAEIVECIKYISNEESKYLTGQTINLNGGLF
ncbi:MAG: SDR family oxidoreductase [Ignavibacteria bacterium]|nr:SDR family oxidoreductase [Ignavibacteria bacterium]